MSFWIIMFDELKPNSMMKKHFWKHLTQFSLSCLHNCPSKSGMFAKNTLNCHCKIYFLGGKFESFFASCANGGSVCKYLRQLKSDILFIYKSRDENKNSTNKVKLNLLPADANRLRIALENSKQIEIELCFDRFWRFTVCWHLLLEVQLEIEFPEKHWRHSLSNFKLDLINF